MNAKILYAKTPCPFCGAEQCAADYVLGNEGSNAWTVVCRECGANGPLNTSACTTPEQAVREWDDRKERVETRANGNAAVRVIWNSGRGRALPNSGSSILVASSNGHVFAAWRNAMSDQWMVDGQVIPPESVEYWAQLPQHPDSGLDDDSPGFGGLAS